LRFRAFLLSEKTVVFLLSAKGHLGPCFFGQEYLFIFSFGGKMEVTMSHWRKLHEPAPQHSYLADWVIAASVVLALVLIAHG
jgi:hypothetical protein